MKNNINRMSFDLSGTISKDGLEDLMKLVQLLCVNNAHNKYTFNDIRISHDDTSVVVEWTPVLKSEEDDCRWVFKDGEHLLVKQINFPDGSYDFAIEDSDEEFLWDKWKKNHPEWHLGKYHTWVNSMEECEDNMEIKPLDPAEVPEANMKEIDWAPLEDGDNPMLDEIFDEEEKDTLKGIVKSDTEQKELKA